MIVSRQKTKDKNRRSKCTRFTNRFDQLEIKNSSWYLSLSLFLSSCSLNARFCRRSRINMNRDTSAYTELSRQACSCNCTPTRPTTVGYRLDLDNDSPSGHRAPTVSPSPGFSFRFLCISTLMHVHKRYSFYRSLYSMYNPHLRIFLYTQEFRVIDMALIFNDLSARTSFRARILIRLDQREGFKSKS